MAESRAAKTPGSEAELRKLLDSAHQTIKTLELRVAMQERSYVVAMREKNAKIRELQAHSPAEGQPSAPERGHSS